MEMTDSLSNLSAGDGGSSLRDATFVPSGDANSDLALHESTAAHQSSGSGSVSANELTVISQNPNLEHQKQNATQLEGRRIGNFELKQFLGGGGMGLVFRAFDTVLSRSVAIKMLPRNNANPELIQRFQVEARSAARLDHPNISRIFQVGSEEICDYIIFEFVEGDNLAQLVRRIGPLPLELGLRYSFQLALAIQHAYQRGVVHRDVKPANVVVTDGGKLKLIDLGLARSPKANDSDQSLTATGVTLGTYDYLSPEQARDSRAADVRSDLYSLGCTIFFMFTGQPPYPQGTPIEKIIQHSSEKRPNPSDYRSDLPSGFNEITSKLLAINPDDRYQRPAELIAEIQEFATRNNIPLLGYDDNVIVKRIIQKPSWRMQLLPVLVPIVLLIGFVLYLDWADRKTDADYADRARTESLRDPSDLRRNETGSKESSAPTGKQDSSFNLKKQSDQSPGASKESDSTNGNPTPKSNGSSSQKNSLNPKSEAQRAVLVCAAGDSVDNGLKVESLDAALEAVNNDPRLDEIRLYKSSYVLTRPVSVKVNDSLRFVSAGETESIIVFRPEAEVPSSLLKIRGGQVEFRSVHLRLETSKQMAGEVSPEDYVGTLIELEGISSAGFSGCSMTVDNFDDNGQKILPRARFLSVTETKKNTMFDIAPKENAMSKPALTFNKCCLRGEADFVHLPQSFPVTIALTNGLFVSDGRMFDFGPAEERTESVKSEIEIYLTSFTSIASLGFATYDVSGQGEAAQPNAQTNFLPIRIDAVKSILNYGNNISFIRHQNVGEGIQKNKLLVLKCEDSFFPQKNPLWTIGYTTQSELEVLDFNAMGDWLNVMGVAGDTAEVTWENFEGLAIPPSEHTVFDYKLSGGWERNPAIRKKSGVSTAEFKPIPVAVVE